MLAICNVMVRKRKRERDRDRKCDGKSDGDVISKSN